ncbi:MAG TPA: uroporphyrinogen-III synthase [Candidatus Deferrimicrobiaceae bacterium]|jgi:uroporphyrinogen-III synthase
MPLRGIRVLVTRGEGQAREFADLIRGRGGVPVLFPTVRIVAVDDPGPLDAAISALPSFDWLLFSSANGVRYFAPRATAAIAAGLPPGLRIGSVGPGTTRAVSDAGMTVFLEAGTHTAEGLLDALAKEGISGKRFLVPRAAEGREALVDGLVVQGGIVVAPVTYRTGLPDLDEGAARAIAETPPDVCAFASPSAFRNFILLLGEDRARSILSSSTIAVIGEVTARSVENRDMSVGIMPDQYTIAGMLDAIEVHFRQKGAAR